MKALVLESPGDPPALAVREVPEPRVGPRDVLVKVEACGLCYHDVLVMRGVLRRGVKPRVVLGHEFAGEVVEVGQVVFSVSPGDRVVSILTEPCGNCDMCASGREHRCRNGVGIGHGADGAFAEYVKVSENALVPLPEGLDPLSACLLACPIGVALHALRDAGNLRAGETALITGSGGGVGVHALQLARALGAQVLAVTTSPHKAERLEALGADQVILADDLDFAEVALALTGDRGVDLALNIVGSPAFEGCWRALAQFGRLVLVGEVTGGQIRLNPAEAIFRDASFIGVSGVSRRQVADAAQLVRLGRLRPLVSQTFPLEGALEAYRQMMERRSFGRLALVPG